MLPRVMNHGITVTESMRQAALEFQRVVDPLGVYLTTDTIFDPTNDSLIVPCDLLVGGYNAARKAVRKTGMTSTAFGLALRRLRPAVERVQRTVNGVPHTWVYVHIALREPNR